MTPSQQLRSIREFLENWLSLQSYPEQLTGDQAPSESPRLAESVLIRGGFYSGRVFSMGPFRAIWSIQDQRLLIEDADGLPIADLDMPAIEKELRPNILSFSSATSDGLRRAA